MIENLETRSNQQRAGLAQDQPREVLRHDAGPARHRAVGQLILSELTPLGPRSTAFYLPRWTRKGEACSSSLRPTRSSPRRPRQTVELGEGLVGQCARDARESFRTCPTSTYAGQFEPRRGRSAQHPRPARALRGASQGGDRARLVPASPIHMTFLEQLTAEHRRRLQQIEATMRTKDCSNNRKS